jgi:hypothetical protein
VGRREGSAASEVRGFRTLGAREAGNRHLALWSSVGVAEAIRTGPAVARDEISLEGTVSAGVIEGERQHQGRRGARRLTAVVLLALAASLLPSATGQVEVLAVPVTVSDDVDVPLPDAGHLGAAGADLADTVRSRAVEAPMTFSMLGFELPEGVDELRVRTSVDGRDWSDWVATERVEAVDGPDAGTEEAAGDRSRAFAEPVWAEEANYFQVEVPDGDVSGDLRAEVIDSVGHSGQEVERRVITRPADEADASSRPRVISRAEWGANESWAGSPSYASRVHMGVVHHTATSNSYSDARAVMRSMYHYHTQSLGWKDLGYNIVIDREGNVYEGRKGGLENGVIGAHARNFNTGSFGVSVIGNYENANPTSASLRALEKVIAWQSRVYGINPSGTTTAMDGTRRSTIVGHRQVGQTACPGRIQNHLESIRTVAAANSIQFPDVAGTHRPAVLALADRGIINGCADNLFCPSRGLTRGQMATLMARALNLKESSSAQRFRDVPTHHPHRAGIHALVEAGVVTGYPDNTFRPQNDVARDQMATFIANGLKLDQLVYTGRFRDVGPLNSHARAVEAVAREGITKGCNSDGTLYCPSDTLRRDQAASLLHRALVE